MAYNTDMNKRRKAKRENTRFWGTQAVILLVLAGIISSLIFIPGNDVLIPEQNASVLAVAAPAAENENNKADGSKLAIEITDINSQYALLAELSSGQVLAEKNGYEKMYPASMTKIMTAVLALEYFDDLNSEIELNSNMFQYIEEQNASVAGFHPGERVRVIDLLYGVMLPSGADAAIALANVVGGTESGFAKLMTKKAHELGAVNTNFVNCTGLHDDNHYTTAYDMAIILGYALKNETFKNIASTPEYTTAKTNKHPSGLSMKSTVFNAIKNSGKTNEYIKGGKTGFTLEGCQCLASFAEKNGKTYILITAKAGTEYSSRATFHIKDAFNIYERYAVVG